MAEVSVNKMVPGTVYRVGYQIGPHTLTHEATFTGRTVTATGDYLVFDPEPEGRRWLDGIYVPSVRWVETVEGD